MAALGTVIRRGALPVLAALTLGGAAPPPSVPEPGAPELAALGPDGVGVTSRVVVDRGQLDPVASLRQRHKVLADRELPLRIWYPAHVVQGDFRVTYHATLESEPPRRPAPFTVPGIAVEDAPPLTGAHPVVVLSHGYNNDPAMQAWLAENLASKGYVVVGVMHRDPPITDTALTPATLLRRPLDIVFVLRRIRAGLLGTMADTARIALAGYSYGGYGVMQVAGGRLDPASPMVGLLPPDLVKAYAGQGTKAETLNDLGVRAVVAIAPAGGVPWSVWGGTGLDGVRAPLLVIAATADRRVGWEQGPRAVFEAARHADRTLLAFKGAGHAIGTVPAPDEMRGNVWDYDWFEDRVWRKARINAIANHFITAFLDLHLKGDASRAAYFAVPSDESDGAAWQGPAAPYGAVSAGGANPTWKGFVRDHQDGLILRHLPAAP